MIEKITNQNQVARHKLAEKINELVDVVNKQQDIIRQIGEWGSSKGECLWCDTLTEFNPEKPQDPYAEQRKWIGKLCRAFDDDETTATVFGILEKIIGPANPYLVNGAFYEHCEPVKPDDDIIYKGEQ